MYVSSEMARKRRNLYLDERCWEVADKVADELGKSAPRWVEELLIKVGIERGYLPKDAQPLGDMRVTRHQEKPLEPGEFKYKHKLHRVLKIKGKLVVERWDEELERWMTPRQGKQLLKEASKVEPVTEV